MQPRRGQAVEQALDELALQQDVVGARFADRFMERGCFVARKRNQAEARVVAAQARCGADAVEPWHVKIDNDGVGVERLRELDCLQAVGGGSDHHELRLPVDQFLK